MLLIHLSFEEIIAELNSAKPTSAIEFLCKKTLINLVLSTVYATICPK